MIDIDMLFKEWLEVKKTEVKAISYDKYENTGKLYVLPFLKQQPIDALDVSSISAFLDKKADDGLSNSTIQIIKMTLKSFYYYVEEKYPLKHIDFSLIKIPLNKKLTSLDEYQEKIIYEYCYNHVDALGVTIILCLYAGLRYTEICALKYSDIDIDNGTITVTKKVQRKVNRNNNLSKTVFSTVDLVSPERRVVGLSQFTIFYLKLFMSQEQPDYDCYILNKRNKIPEQRAYQRKLKDLSNELGFDVNFNILRNTCKDNCIKNNVSINTILNTLGVTSIMITADSNIPNDINHNKKEMNKIIP
ncbi:MAG: tyrosine-type recombinase/integrase [Erysipelotrichaceae bacterium]|nr:tyrosine-type recombinase/integrase [Erysipelotrichaceae bacterium]